MAVIVVLPGWGQEKGDWQNFNLGKNELRHEIIELPGFGSTPLINDSWSIPDYATYVENEITQRGHKEVILLGHSFGGRIAAYIASRQPDWLKALILYGAPCLYSPSLKTKLLIALAKTAKKVGIKKKLSPNAELKEAEARGMGQIFKNAVGFDQQEFLPKITAKTLLIWGDKDTEAPVTIAREMHRLIPHSTLEILEKSGHNLHIDNNYLFYAKIKHFISNL